MQRSLVFRDEQAKCVFCANLHRRSAVWNAALLHKNCYCVGVLKDTREGQGSSRRGDDDTFLCLEVAVAAFHSKRIDYSDVGLLCAKLPVDKSICFSSL